MASERAVAKTGANTVPTPPAETATPEPSADTDRLGATAPSARHGLMAWLNPLRWFRRHTVENCINLGRDLLDNGSLGQAAIAFQQALDMDADCTAAYRGLGRVFYKKGGRSNYETALKHYQEAIKRDPNEHDLYVITAKIYDHLGKRKEATLERKKFIIVRALEADPQNAVANNNMGILFLQQGRMNDALDYFNRAIQGNSRYDIAYRNLAAAYHHLAKQAPDPAQKAEYHGKSREAIQKALEIAPSPQSLMAQARILMMDGSLLEVLNILQRVDQMTPANADVQLLKKMALEGLGRFEEAKAAHQSYLAFKRQASLPDDPAAAAEPSAE